MLGGLNHAERGLELVGPQRAYGCGVVFGHGVVGCGADGELLRL
jgi:hypothetical protein